MSPTFCPATWWADGEMVIDGGFVMTGLMNPLSLEVNAPFLTIAHGVA